ncbi:MAG: hypothetical protein KA354_13655 [Phycisphaerae bacterium]|nr:hypothetical protein [Phycisphaerae bacterium]
MSNGPLVERQRWFRFFPDGSIEFLVITRVLMVLLLVALIVFIARQLERSATLVALAGICSLDQILVLWWAVQIVTDLSLLANAQSPPGGEGEPRTSPATTVGSNRERRWLTARACLPGTVALLLLALMAGTPILSVFLRVSLSKPVLGAVYLALGAVFILLLPFGQRALQHVRLGPPLWTFLSLIPIVHMFAVHRVARDLESQIRLLDQQRSPAPSTPAEEPGTPAGAIAEVAWILTIVPWAIVAVVMLTRGEWPRGWAGSIPTCGGILATTLLVIADTAALEHVHRRFVALIRRK